MLRNLGRSLAALALVTMAAGGLAVAQGGDTIRIATALAQNSLAPGEATGLPDATVIRTMFEGLVGFTDGELVNELATSWSANEEATAYTFELREGVTFHDCLLYTSDAA